MSGGIGRNWLVGYAGIVAIGLLLAGLVWWQTERDAAVALDRYRAQAAADTASAARRVQDALTQTYQNIRTISLLPSVRGIDRHASNLSDSDKQSVQQIYNNLHSNVAVSEVYIVPVDLEPDAIDPVTGAPQVPILMFDDAIGADGTYDPGKPEQVEIYEYRQLRAQNRWLAQHYPRQDAIKGLEVPVVSGAEIITCDNSEFEKSHADADRKGMMFSVPFYGPDGALKGTVTAVLRTAALRSILPATDAALVYPHGRYQAASLTAGQQDASAAWVAQGRADPGLLYSASVPVVLPDPLGQWAVWAGHPDSAFVDGPDLGAVRLLRYGAWAVDALLVALGLLAMAYVERRVVRPAQALSAAVRHISADRAQAIPCVGRRDYLGDMARSIVVMRDAMIEKKRLEEAQVAQRAQAMAEQTRSLRSMADRVEDAATASLADLAHVAADVEEASSDMSALASGVRQDCEAVGSLAGRSLADADQMAAASGRLGTTVAGITSEMLVAGRVSRDAVVASAGVEATVHELVSAMGQVVDVVQLIESISSRTNLLALNATIEAARAGEAGRGFAIVAGEVKSLANQTAAATTDIRRRIASIRVRTDQALVRVGDMRAAVLQSETAAEKVAGMAHVQAEVTREITDVIGRTARSAHEVAGLLHQMMERVATSETKTLEVRQAARATSSRVGELRTALVRIVRTASEHANRRHFDRVAVCHPATLRQGAVRVGGLLRDISRGGARFEANTDGLLEDAECTLLLQGETEAWPASLRAVQDGSAGLRWSIDAMSAGRLSGRLEALLADPQRTDAHAPGWPAPDSHAAGPHAAGPHAAELSPPRQSARPEPPHRQGPSQDQRRAA